MFFFLIKNNILNTKVISIFIQKKNCINYSLHLNLARFITFAFNEVNRAW
jgi:hypothetical protein